MAGFDYKRGRSNNMVAAEKAGKITIGRWAKRYGVSAKAATWVMQPTEAHHTGTGRRGKSRLTPVLPRELEPTAEQLAAMKRWDSGDRPPVKGWFIKWRRVPSDYGRGRVSLPTVGLFVGDPAEAPKGFEPLDDAEFERAREYEGRRLRAYADSFDQVKD